MSATQRKSIDKTERLHPSLRRDSKGIIIPPLMSQIPGLNGVFDDDDESDQPKIIYVKDTDSEYIRRCKLGGSSDLLQHVDPATCKSKAPVPYARPLWWDVMCDDFMPSPDLDDNQQQERASAMSRRTASSRDPAIRNEQDRSPSRQPKTASTQSRLSQSSRRK